MPSTEGINWPSPIGCRILNMVPRGCQPTIIESALDSADYAIESSNSKVDPGNIGLWLSASRSHFTSQVSSIIFPVMMCTVLLILFQCNHPPTLAANLHDPYISQVCLLKGALTGGPHVVCRF